MKKTYKKQKKGNRKTFERAKVIYTRFFLFVYIILYVYHYIYIYRHAK